MANPEHLAILKQGVELWNRWRRENPNVNPRLSSAYLNKLRLIGCNFRGADLSGARLIESELWNADLTRANLARSNLRKAKLVGCNLDGAGLFKANLEEAVLIDTRLHHTYMTSVNLGGADLNSADFFDVDLEDSSLRGAELYHTILRHVRMQGADLTGARMFGVTFANIDLGWVIGLDTVLHSGPSSIDFGTLVRSVGTIPTQFLRGCGAPEHVIEYSASLINKPPDFYSCFISYSTKDQEFAEHLNTDLQSKGVRCWFAPEDLKIGDKFRAKIDENIQVYDKLLLVLSAHSVQSDWVEKEVETALEREREQKCTMLFPIRLDDSVMEIKTGWPADIRRTRHLGDFTNWKDHDAYQKAFTRLLRDLKAESAQHKP